MSVFKGDDENVEDNAEFQRYLRELILFVIKLTMDKNVKELSVIITIVFSIIFAFITKQLVGVILEIFSLLYIQLLTINMNETLVKQQSSKIDNIKAISLINNHYIDVNCDDNPRKN